MVTEIEAKVWILKRLRVVEIEAKAWIFIMVKLEVAGVCINLKIKR